MSLVEATCHSLFFFYLIFFLALHSSLLPHCSPLLPSLLASPIVHSPWCHRHRFIPIGTPLLVCAILHATPRVPSWPAPWRTQPCGGRSPAIVPLRVVLPDPAPPAAHTAHHHPQCAPDETEGDVVQVGRVNFFILGDGINPDTEGMFF